MKSVIYPPGYAVRRSFSEYIKAEKPEASVMTLGKSILGQPIELYKIGSGKTSLLLVGAHHGSEYITASLLYSLILKMLSGKKTHYGKEMALYLKSFSIYIVPVLNPDGVDTSLYGVRSGPLEERQRRMIGEGDVTRWQANARGVDLNHNYEFGFFKYKVIEAERGIMAGATLYSGEYPESEPETAAIMRLVRSVDLKAVVSLHSQGEEIYYYPKDNKVSKDLAEFLKASLGYEISKPEGGACYGGLCDYTAGSLGIPSITLEVGRGTNPLPKGEFTSIRGRMDKALFLLPTLL